MERLVKYSNRKLYLKDSGSYVDLEFVKDLVKNNKDFEITDFESGRDLTLDVLKRVVVKCDVDAKDIKRLIRYSR